MRNLPLLDAPYNIFKLEVFDMLLILTIPSPFIAFAIIIHPLFAIPYPFVVVSLAFKIRNLKKDKAYGYMQRRFLSLSDGFRERLGLGDNKFYP